MGYWKILLILTALCLLSLTSEAQYTLAKKGDVVAYQEAVIIDLPAYRLIRKKIERQGMAISSYGIQFTRLEQLAADRAEQVEKQRLAILEQKASIDVYKRNTDQIKQELLDLKGKPTKWYRRPEVWAGAGFVFGILIAK